MSSSRNRRGPSSLVLILVGIAALLTGWTAMNYRGGAPDDDNASDRQTATATVLGCEEEGPLSASGVGYWWSCEIKISTEDGEKYEQTLPGSRFEPSDKGKDFKMVSGGFNSSTWMRTDLPSNTLATTVTAVGLVIGLCCLVVGIHRLVRRRLTRSGHPVGVALLGECGYTFTAFGRQEEVG